MPTLNPDAFSSAPEIGEVVLADVGELIVVPPAVSATPSPIEAFKVDVLVSETEEVVPSSCGTPLVPPPVETLRFAIVPSATEEVVFTAICFSLFSAVVLVTPSPIEVPELLTIAAVFRVCCSCHTCTISFC
ncbi:hypothetical protein D3C86_844830 [compost metagenome]